MGEYRQGLERILREAGDMLAEGFSDRDKECRKKGAIDLVTRWDCAIEAFLKDALGAAFPGHGFLGEESGASDQGRERTFVIDPVDGTTNFVHGFPFCCVSVACVAGQELLAGGICAPLLGELYLAERGEGAFCNGKRLAVSAETRLEDSLFVTGFSYERRTERERMLRLVGNAIDATRGVRRTGSAALDLCYVARGVFDCYIESGIQSWDIAAGALLVEEAGGKVTLFSGSPLDIHARQIVASNGRVHDAALNTLLDGI